MQRSLLRKSVICGVLMSFLMPHMVLAGSLTFVDGKGSWVSTQCQFPTPPSDLARDPEMAANDLNVKLSQHNQFAAAVQDYMNCISQEARQDASGVSQLVAQDAGALMQEGHDQVRKSATRLERKE